MNRYFVLTALVFGLGTSCLAQKEENDSKKAVPPAAAKAALLKAFPGSTDVKWEKEEGNYEAEFKVNGAEMSAEFDAKGAMLESEATIKTSELPPAVTQYVKEHYKGATIKEAAKITRTNGEINYEAEVKKMALIFDASGKFIKKGKE